MGKRAKVAYDVITSNPRENIYVVPGDTVHVTSEDKTFYAFGATGGVGEFVYTEIDYSLNKALAAVSGLVDSQADPAQVLIYREEDPRKLAQMGLDIEQFGDDQKPIPTVYRTSFRKPDSFFMAKNFLIKEEDVIYVSNADSVTISKVIQTATGILGAPSRLVAAAGVDN